MCLTSNFALSFIADNRVLAAVTLQPAVPPFSEGELHICPEDVSEIRDALD